MESEDLDPENHEFEDDEIETVEVITSVASTNVGIPSGNFDVAQFMAAMKKMMEQQTQQVIGEIRRLNQKIERSVQVMNQEMMEEIKQTNEVKKQEMMEEIEQEEVKRVDIEADQQIEGSEEKPLDAELDGASARVVQTVDMVQSRPPTFGDTSSFGVLKLQFEEATWQNDCSMVPDYTEGTEMDAFRDGVGDPDIRGGVLLSPRVTFAETVAYALTGEAALDIVKPAARIRRVEVEQPNNCSAEGDKRPRSNEPGNNWPLRKVQNGHGRMRYWICGRAGRILRDGWKRRRKKVRKKVRTPSAMGRVPREIRRVTGRKRLSGSDVLGMDALMGRRGQVDVGHHGRMEEKESIIDVGRMQISQAGEWIGDGIRRQQLEDLDLSMMVKFRKEDHRPVWSEMANGSSALEACWTQLDSLSIGEVRLRRMWESSDAKWKQSLMVVPRTRIAEVLGKCHGEAGEGHLGVSGTLARVSEIFYWSGCRQSVAGWCRGCEGCTAAEDAANRSRVFFQMNVGEATIERMEVDQRAKVRFDMQADDGGKRTKGSSRRLQPEWEGPCRVRERDGRCVLGELHGGSRVVHLERSVLYTGGGLDPVRDEQVWAEGSVTN